MDWSDAALVVAWFVVPFALFVIRGWVRGRRAEREVSEAQAGGRASLPCRARGDDPYPATWRRCHLDLGPDGAVLRPKDRGQAAVHLPAGRLAVLHARGAGSSDDVRDRNDEQVLVMLADGAGASLQLVVPVEQVDGLLGVLQAVGDLRGHDRARRVDAPPLRHRRVRSVLPPWAMVSGACAVLAAAVLGGLWLGSDPVRAVVSGPADQYDLCPVVWADLADGSRREAEISCGDEAVGDLVDGLALPRPFAGEIFDTETFPVLSALVAAWLVIGTVAGAVGERVGRRRDAAELRHRARWQGNDGGAGRADVDVPELTADTLDLDSVARVAAVRAVREAWGTGAAPPRPVSAAQVDTTARWMLAVVRRIVGIRAASALGVAGFAALFALQSGWTAWGAWSALGAGPVSTATAEVGETSDGPPFLVDDLDVTFPVPGQGRVTTFVALSGDVPDGPVTVQFSGTDPERARLVGPGDGTGRGMLQSAVLGAVAVGTAGWSLRRAAATARAVLGAVRGVDRRELDYVMVADPDGDAALLLFEASAAPPRWVVFLAEPVLGTVALTGRAEVRGELVEDEVVVPVLPERVLWPSGPVAGLDPELTLLLATGLWPDDELDDDESDEP